MRRLIINADDFGLTEGVNRAILEGHRRGVITSTTLMANGTRFSSAARFAQSAPELVLGAMWCWSMANLCCLDNKFPLWLQKTATAPCIYATDF